MGINVENDSFDELDQEISLVKKGPGTQSGGTPPRQSGGHLKPGGECFAPNQSRTFLMLPRYFLNLGRSL